MFLKDLSKLLWNNNRKADTNDRDKRRLEFLELPTSEISILEWDVIDIATTEIKEVRRCHIALIQKQVVSFTNKQRLRFFIPKRVQMYLPTFSPNCGEICEYSMDILWSKERQITFTVAEPRRKKSVLISGFIGISVVDKSIEPSSNNAHMDTNLNLSSKRRAKHGNEPPTCSRDTIHDHSFPCFWLASHLQAKLSEIWGNWPQVLIILGNDQKLIFQKLLEFSFSLTKGLKELVGRLCPGSLYNEKAVLWNESLKYWDWFWKHWRGFQVENISFTVSWRRNSLLASWQLPWNILWLLGNTVRFAWRA